MYWTSYPNSTSLDNSWAAPCPGQDALFVCVVAFELFFPRRTFGHLFFNTSSTEWKEQFSLLAVRQDGMVEVTWRQDFALDQPEVLLDVGVTRL